MSKHEHAGERPFWYDGKSVNEVGFCEDFLQQHPMVCGRQLLHKGCTHHR